jgi:hypothetical protein
MWSIVEILELICISEKAICIVVSRPSDDIHTEEEIIGSEKLKEATVDLRAQQKLSTSERLRPKGQIENVISFEKLFRE